MNIKHGDIVTLDNGDTVKISLEVIKKITQLTQGKEYMLQYTGAFCHLAVAGRTESYLKFQDFQDLGFIYVGHLESTSGGRYIFYSSKGSKSVYCMFADSDLKFVKEEL